MHSHGLTEIDFFEVFVPFIHGGHNSRLHYPVQAAAATLPGPFKYVLEQECGEDKRRVYNAEGVYEKT